MSKKQPAIIVFAALGLFALLVQPVAAKTSAAGGASSRSRAKTASSAPTPAKKIDPNVALLARGAKLHREGKIDEAEVVFRQVLAKDPRSVDAFYDLGAIAESRGDYIGALSNYHAALALRPDDREFKEAVRSTEITLRKNGSAMYVSKAASSAIGTSLDLQTRTPDLNIAAAAAEANANANATIGQSSETVDPVFALSAPEAPPVIVDGKKFQLSSRKGEIVPPTLGVSPSQFPDLPTTLNGGMGANVCPPPASNPPTLTVGQNPPNHRMRRAASMILMVGAGAALSGTGLHCPICHMLNTRF